MNPPFGTRRNGADMEFLSMALQVRTGACLRLAVSFGR
jgi:rRNA N6-adenosine-methyltransferase METTL5